jgi:hypothetical protein
MRKEKGERRRKGERKIKTSGNVRDCGAVLKYRNRKQNTESQTTNIAYDKQII